MQHYLPAEVDTLLDVDSLEIQKDNFIDPDLQEHFSDMPDALRPYLPEFRYHLTDLSQYNDDEIKTWIERAVIL